MRYIGKCSLRYLALALVAGACLAEDAAPSKFYKLDFVVREVEGGKVLNARSYSVTVTASTGGLLDRGCSIRTGSRTLLQTSATSSQWEDVGVNLDCHHVREMPNGLSLDVDASINGVMRESAAPPASLPTVRQNKWSSTVIVPLKKPTVIYSSDDVTGKGQMQLEVTATPIT